MKRRASRTRPYVSLAATFRRDGREVRTPVRIAPEPDAGKTGPLYVYTNATATAR
ncbi:MAG: hypothetical protein MZV70_45295 [Desulfobacterales bacterium]|nr:hypothetical protein [Desulfobacterales bacterium]